MGLLVDVAVTAVLLLALSVPLALSVAALLDAARRPGWAWALAGRRQVVWLALIMFAIISVVGGLVVSLYYLVRVRPHLRAVESGGVA